MYCVCINKESGDLSVMERTERDRSNNVLMDAGQIIPTWVLSVKDTLEDAEKYIQDIKDANDLIEKTFNKENDD